MKLHTGLLSDTSDTQVAVAPWPIDFFTGT